MRAIARQQSIFHLLSILLNLLVASHSIPLNRPSIAQPKDSIYNQLIKGQTLVVHEETGVVFSRVGYYYEVDDIFGLTVSVPVTQYVCSILPMEQAEKLSLCAEYHELLRSKIEQEDLSSHSSVSDFLNSTNNTGFSSEKVPTKTHHRHHQRSKRFIPLIILGVAAGGLGLFLLGTSIFNSVKGAMLSSRVSDIQNSVSDTNKQLHSLEVSVFTNTNSATQLARSFSKAQENMESMRDNVETIVSHISRLNSFAEAQTRYNLKTHAELVYERMKNSMRRIEQNDLNLDFVGMVEQNEILEIAYEHLQRFVPSTRESKATFVSRMLFAQTVQFFPTENGTHTNDTTGYYPEHLGNIVFTSYFSALKTDPFDKIQVYKITALPFYTVEKEKGRELSGLLKMVGLSNSGYIEWRDISEQQVCDFGDYIVCRDPPLIQKRINNMCLEQLVSTNRSFHCHVQDSPYSSPHFEKIRADVLVVSTRTPINCATTAGSYTFKNLTLVQLSCNDTFYCDCNINFVGDKRCQVFQPYVLKTVNEDVVSVVEPIRPLNISLLEVYPSASDKDLILTLEEQMKIPEKNTKDTERTATDLARQGTFGATRPAVIVFAVAMSVLAFIVLFLTLCLLNHYCRNTRATNSPIVNIGTTGNQPTNSVQTSAQEELSSLHDLLRAFAINKIVNKSYFCVTALQILLQIHVLLIVILSRTLEGFTFTISLIRHIKHSSFLYHIQRPYSQCPIQRTILKT